jgi:hypothetical protein
VRPTGLEWYTPIAEVLQAREARGPVRRLAPGRWTQRLGRYFIGSTKVEPFRMPKCR